MRLRAILLGLVVLATIGFVVGTSIERHNTHHESVARLQSEGMTPRAGDQHAAKVAPERGKPSESRGETPAKHAAEGRSVEAHRELRPLGIDIEALPFVILAALTSLALVAGAWLRRRSIALLAVLAVVMAVFGALDVREIFHQNDEARTGLAILAAAIAALHFGAAAVAARLAART